MKRKSPRQYAEILYEITNDVSAKSLDATLRAFVELLVQDHAISQGGAVIDAFTQLTKEKTGVKQLSVTSARELSEKELQKIAATFGKTVEVNTAIDPTLLGGVAIRTGDTIIDGSLKTQLKRLEEELI